MRSVALFLAVLLIGVPGLALALVEGGIELTHPGEAQPTEPPREEYIEGWNDDQPYQSAGTYAAQCFGFAYVPSVSYVLERIEFHAGGVGGPVTVSLLEDDGSGEPTGAVLGTVSYEESATHGWQGDNLIPPVFVTAGTLYYIKYQVVVGADASTAASGVIIPHYWSYDCVTWDGYAPYEFWMARFYGQPQNSTERNTWGTIKSLYR